MEPENIALKAPCFFLFCLKLRYSSDINIHFMFSAFRRRLKHIKVLLNKLDKPSLVGVSTNIYFDKTMPN